MIPEELRQQIDRWLDGDLSDAEAEAVTSALRKDVLALEYFTDRAVLEQMLSGRLSNISLTAAVAAVPSAIGDSAGVAVLAGRRLQGWLWAASAVMCCVVISLVLWLPAVAAGPAELVRLTLADFQPALDRCYGVQVQPEGPLRRFAGRRRQLQSDSTLWVREQSFVQVFQSAEQRLTWGRDAAGDVWFTIGGRTAAVFRSDEVPPVLQEICDLRTLQMPTLLETLLRDYELEYGVQEGGLSTILAQRKAESGSAKYGAAEIQIESRTRLVRHVSLERIADDRLLAVLNFSLREVRPQSAALYQLRTHLQTDSLVLDRGSRTGARADLLREFLQLLRNVPAENGQGQVR